MANTVKSGYWWSEGKVGIEDINTDLFTHVYFAFVDLDPKTHEIVIVESKKEAISNFSETLKDKNDNIKTLLSIGSRDGLDRKAFSEMVKESGNRQKFIDSSIGIARQYEFDGLDLHWLYPSNGLEMSNLGHLVKDWRTNAGDDLLLVASVYYLPTISENVSYPIHEMKNNLNWINVQPYDFYTPQSSPSRTGPAHAYLNPNPNPTNNFLYGQFGLDDGWFKKAKFPADKLILGLPFYGWAWKLHSPHIETGIFSPATGPATDISPDGRVDYGTIVDFIPNFPDSSQFLKTYIASYAFQNNTWVAYDDEVSIKAKILQARKDLNFLLRGYFAWHVGGDDSSFTLATAAHDA